MLKKMLIPRELLVKSSILKRLDHQAITDKSNQ